MKLQTGALVIFWTFFLGWIDRANSQVQCGHRNISTTVHSRVKRVIGGSEAKRNSWPWIVNFIDDKSLQQCAGSIIDREWVLTAAHCFLFNTQPHPIYNNYTFHFADHRLNFTDPGEYKVTTSKIYVHPKYSLGDLKTPGDYDIALMKLPKPINYTDHVRPICVGEVDDIFSENDTCYLIGWGNTRNVTKYYRSPVLKEAELKLVDIKECNSNTSYKGVVSERFICAGFKQGGIDGCYGDSGGPLQCDRNGTWIQVGIMIWGLGCAKPNHYGVYTDVRVLQPFIKAITAGPNANLTSYYMRTMTDVRSDIEKRSSSNLYKLLTNEGMFSDIDLVRNLQLVPYQISLLNKTTLMDLVFVSLKQNLTANATTLKFLAQVVVRQADRLYVHSKSKEVVKEFNISFEEIYKSSNLTKDEFLSSMFSVIDKTRKQLYIKKYINTLVMYRDTLLTYQPGLNVAINNSKIKKDLDRPVNELKKLDEKSLKQILVNQNQNVFTKLISMRNISSFFETSLEKLKNMTVAEVLSDYLNINVTTFASLHDLTPRDIDVVKMRKISSVSYPDDESLYGNSFACGVRNEHKKSRAKRVVGGKEATINSWPWMVNFIKNSLQECAGSIIDRKWILTAAHCFARSEGIIPLSNYSYHVADHRLNFSDPHERTIEASKVFIHPHYIAGSNDLPGDYDIALIELAKPLTFSKNVRPVCIVEEEDRFMSETCYVTGWGNTEDTGVYHRSPVLKEVKLDLVSREECNSNTSYDGIILDRFICAGSKEGGTDGCFGDSGGPLQCDRNGSWVQIGVMSWGIGCARANYYGVYANVRLLLPFINAVKSGPNVKLTTYFLKSLEELIPVNSERATKYLHLLLTNNKEFSDIDLVRNLQLSPFQFKVLNKTILMDLVFVSDKRNLTRNGTILKYIAQMFLNQASRLNMYFESRNLAKQLNISFDEILQLSNLTKQTFLDSKSGVLENVRKAIEINLHFEKLREYKDNLMAYKDNLSVTLDDVKIRKQFMMLSLKEIKDKKEKTLKQIIVNENGMLFTKILTIRNISTFFNITNDILKSMSVPDLLNEVLGIKLNKYEMLHMFTDHQLDVIKRDKISSVDYSDDKSLYEITKAILQVKALEASNKCNEKETSCSKNADCIRKSEYSFLCRCKKGYVGNGVECNTGNEIYSSELVINQTFTEALNNPNSVEYIDLAETIENSLTNGIKKTNNFPGFLGCQVTGFIKGSVIAQYVLVFQIAESQTVNVSKLSQVVRTAVRNGSLQISGASVKPLKSTDLCSLGSHSCHKDATCSIQSGILTCKCKKNFYGDGKNCADPCQVNKCPTHSYCFRGLNGEAKCICDFGYAREDGECEKSEDFKIALIIVCCVAGTLLLLALAICWYQYCDRNRKKSVDLGSTAANDKGRENSAFDSVDMYNLSNE